MLAAPERLRCEYLADPMGIDTNRPRLSWWPNDSRDAEVQTGYQIIAAADAHALLEATLQSASAIQQNELLERQPVLLWDSGRVDSAETVNISYAGLPLESQQQVCWRVRTFDSDGLASPWSEIGWFETGILHADDWQAQWIGTPLQGSKDTPATVPALRREFDLGLQSIESIVSARLYITALGLYRAHLNGRRIGVDELTPGWTDYEQRLNYQVYDVTSELCDGINSLGVLLGDGWYCGGVGLAGRQCYGDRPALYAQMEIRFEDGRCETIVTDEHWQWHSSEILGSDLLGGESVDGRQRLGNWSSPNYPATHWHDVEIQRLSPPALTPSPAPMMRVVRELNPVAEPVRRRSGFDRERWIYDFGQNFTGRISLRVKAPAGTLLRIRYAERLDATGELYTANLRDAAAIDHYTCVGNPSGEHFEPVFTLHGFEFVEISGRFPRDAVVSIKGQVISAPLETTGEFSCDHLLINRLQDNIAWSQRSSFHSQPLDAPQRDERLAWTGPAQVFCRTAAFNMDTAGFFNKWLLDIEDAQKTDGAIPPVIPLPPGLDALDLDGGAGWSDAYLVCAWTQYRCFNDKRLLARHYDGMRRLVLLMQKNANHHIRDDSRHPDSGGYGDWLAPDAGSNVYEDPRLGATPSDLLGTAYFCYSARLLARIAGVLGNLPDLERFESLANDVRAAFRRRFVTPDGELVQPTQTALVLSLHFGLLERAERKQALDRLVADIKSRNTHLATGVLGTPFLLPVLTAGGELALAYELLLQTSAPGWLYPVTQGATSIWERWDSWTSDRGFQDPAMNSFNQAAFGSVGEWLYQTVAGLDLNPDLNPERNAYSHAHIEPQPPVGKGFPAGAPLRYAEARLDTVHGRFSSRWEIVDNRFLLVVGVPVNCSATVVLPNGMSQEVSAGSHEFEVHLERDVHIPVLDLARQVSV